MISLEDFKKGINDNAARIRDYKKGHSGQDGLADCVGLIIGGLELAGVKYSGIHGSNYFARFMTENLKPLTSERQLQAGDIVYKTSDPGESGYNLPDKYKAGGSCYSDKVGDIDFYHIGEVKSTDPLIIQHCSGGGMNYDGRVGRWDCFGQCKGVNYHGKEPEKESEGERTMIEARVVLPSGSTGKDVNLREKPNGGLDDRVPVGSLINVIQDKGEWCEVKWVSRNKTGWMMSNYIEYLDKDGKPATDQGTSGGELTDADRETIDAALELVENTINVLKVAADNLQQIVDTLGGIFGRG